MVDSERVDELRFIATVAKVINAWNVLIFPRILARFLEEKGEIIVFLKKTIWKHLQRNFCSLLFLGRNIYAYSTFILQKKCL